MSEPNIEVILTDPHEFHCLKLVLRGKHDEIPEGEVPLEIMLHTTQAIDLIHKLSLGISEYFRQASGELLEIKSRSLR